MLSVLSLILTGVAIGPEGLGLITPDIVGDALSTIVGVSVATIIFDATFRLEYGAIWKTSKAVSRMITIGAVIAFVGTALTVRLLLRASWDIAFLIGALLVATGPTAVAPILAVVPVREEVATTLEVEEIVNDVTVVVEAGFERWIASVLGVTESEQ